MTATIKPIENPEWTYERPEGFCKSTRIRGGHSTGFGLPIEIFSLDGSVWVVDRQIPHIPRFAR
jgi:hypothetical protein